MDVQSKKQVVRGNRKQALHRESISSIYKQQTGSTQPHSPLFYLVDPVYSNRDDVLPTFLLGRSVSWHCALWSSANSLSASIPTPLLPLVRSPHMLQTLSLLLVSVLTLQHLSLYCAASCGADDKTSDMSCFSYGNYSLTSRGKWLNPGSYIHTFSFITAHRSPTAQRTTKFLSILFIYDNDQNVWIFLIVLSSFPLSVQFFLSFIKCLSLPTEN